MKTVTGDGNQKESGHPHIRLLTCAKAFERAASHLEEVKKVEVLVRSYLYGHAIELELSRFSGRVNTEVFSLSPPLGRGKLPPRSGGVKGGVRSQRSFMRRLHVGGSARS